MNNLNHFSNQEDLWSYILSEDNEKINNVLNFLSSLELEVIINHLKIMTTEEGWHPSQQRSAAIALNIMQNK